MPRQNIYERLRNSQPDPSKDFKRLVHLYKHEKGYPLPSVKASKNPKLQLAKFSLVL